LGHIHRPQKVEGLSVPTFYCGAPERLSFNEENLIPGFWIHEFEESNYQGSRFIETPARRFITIEHDLRDKTIADLDSWYQELANIYNIDGRKEWLLLPDESGAIIRLKYKATDELAKAINKGEIIKHLQMNSPFYIAEIKADVEKSTRTRAIGASAEMGPLEGLRMWMEVAQVSEKDRDELVARTEELMQEVGVQ